MKNRSLQRRYGVRDARLRLRLVDYIIDDHVTCLVLPFDARMLMDRFNSDRGAIEEMSYIQLH